MLNETSRKSGYPFLLLLASLFLFPAQPSQAASNSPVVILVNGYGDCCTVRMRALIDGLKGLGAVFPAVEGRGLSGSDYSHYVAPWNSFSGVDQGFQVNMDPQSYVQKAMQQNMTEQPGGMLSKLSGGGSSAAMIEDQGVIDKVMGMVRKGSDKQFVDEVSAFVNGLDANTPVILIGHSFGADSVMEVLPKINHKILFVGALDPVGGGGLRRLNRSRKVSDRVSYFYNRWQNSKLFPFDFMTNGEFGDCRASVKCDQKKQRVARSKSGQELGPALGHVELPYDDFIQEEILGIVRNLLGSGSSTGASAAPQETKESVPSKLLQSAPIKGIFGK